MRVRWTIGMICAGLAIAAVMAATPASAKVSCDKVLAASEEAGGSLSPDELAKKLHTNPTRVRHCMGKTQGGKKPVPLRKQPAPGEPSPGLK